MTFGGRWKCVSSSVSVHIVKMSKNAEAEREIKKRGRKKTCTCLNSDARVSFPSDQIPMFVQMRSPRHHACTLNKNGAHTHRHNSLYSVHYHQCHHDYTQIYHHNTALISVVSGIFVFCPIYSGL